MKRLVLSTLVTCALLQYSSLASAEAGWVDDKLYVPLRTGPSSRHTIMHKGLVSGTRLEVIQRFDEEGFVQVRLPDGRDGYIPAQYLSAIPIAEDRLAEAQKTIDALTSKSQPLQQQLLELRNKNKELEQTVGSLSGDKESVSQRLAEIEAISKNHIATSQKNKSLIKENEAHKNSIDVLKADNQRLKQRSNQEWFINGAGAVVLGVILTLVIPRLVPKKKGNDWA
ncbi:MAG: TIGR04211 family SH3 domain-containing protein [Pseudomonadales bacterium]